MTTPRRGLDGMTSPDPDSATDDWLPQELARVRAPAPPPLFIDFEASGLHADSFPVEIGWCDPVDLNAGRDHLIKPTAAWLATRWDSAAERIHGIDRERLCEHGKPPTTVVKALREAAVGHRLYSDNVGHDERWLISLCRAARFQLSDDFKVWCANILFRDLAARHGLNLAEVTRHAKQSAPITHKAADDARHLATVYRILTSS